MESARLGSSKEGTGRRRVIQGNMGVIARCYYIFICTLGFPGVPLFLNVYVFWSLSVSPQLPKYSRHLRYTQILRPSELKSFRSVGLTDTVQFCWIAKFPQVLPVSMEVSQVYKFGHVFRLLGPP